MKKETLEILMQSNSMPIANADCTHKILQAAMRIPQRKSLWKQLACLFDDLSLPAPAYSFASLILIGFVVGFASLPNLSTYEPDALTTFDQLIINDDQGVL